MQLGIEKEVKAVNAANGPKKASNKHNSVHKLLEIKVPKMYNDSK